TGSHIRAQHVRQGADSGFSPANVLSCHKQLLIQIPHPKGSGYVGVASDADPDFGLSLEPRRQRGVAALTSLEDEGLRRIALINQVHDTHARSASPTKYA